MANIPVERTSSGAAWLPWLLGLLALAALIWLGFELFDDDDDDAYVAEDTVTAVEPIDTAEPVAAGAITSIAELADGRNSIGRQVNLDNVQVMTLTGDSSFFVGSGANAAADAGALIILQGMNESESLPPPPTGADGQYNIDEGDVISVEGVITAFDATAPDYADLPAADRDRAMRSGVYINASNVEAASADTEVDAETQDM